MQISILKNCSPLVKKTTFRQADRHYYMSELSVSLYWLLAVPVQSWTVIFAQKYVFIGTFQFSPTDTKRSRHVYVKKSYMYFSFCCKFVRFSAILNFPIKPIIDFQNKTFSLHKSVIYEQLWFKFKLWSVCYRSISA